MDPSTFRRIMGQFPTGVTVLAAKAGDTVHGMTANAFTSVSLQPPLVLICVRQTSRTKPVLDAAGWFAVSILAGDQMEVARIFADPDLDGAQRFARVRWRTGQSGAPILEGCLAYLESRIVATYEAGDHTVYLGEVEHGEVVRPEEAPLVFFRREYWVLNGRGEP
ncbi:MAG: flavin reductase family protein [Armatimonadota bacterium]|nr:flavin reductase family protein [Armatimonadota bacterium]MDR7562569.1 flavin reductase family protein [Armatimonadota bacterium]MDR7567413.1 flavin reductase family protein [Armatimonadota bacterium]MDR7602372.1 flavin reductase family protein [Armatimonadota bacterium]